MELIDRLKEAHDKIYFLSTTVSRQKEMSIIPVEESCAPINEKAIDFIIDDQPELNILNKKIHGIELSPAKIDYGKLPLFEEEIFEFQGEVAKRVYLIGDFNVWSPVSTPMQKNGDNQFQVAVSIKDGECLYRFEVDSEIRLDPNRINEIFIGKGGVCSKIIIARYKKKVSIINNRDKEFSADIHSSADWLIVDKQELSIPCKDKEELLITLIPSKMQFGNNFGSIEIISSGNAKKRYLIDVLSEMIVNGIVPIVKERNFSIAFQKGEVINLPMEIEAIGSGNLEGIITAPHNIIKESLNISNSIPSERKKIVQTINIDTARLSPAQYKGFKAFIVTNTYIWNQRRMEINFEYQMPHLRTSPPAIYFPKVFFGDKKEKTVIKIENSDKSPVNTSLQIPEKLVDYVIAKQLSNNRWEVEFDTKKVTQPGYISDMLKIIDRNSMMESQIHFMAKIITSIFYVEIEELPKRFENSRDGVDCSITNAGKNELKIFSIKLEKEVFRCIPEPTLETILGIGKSLDLKLKTNLHQKLFKEIRLSDTMIIASSDMVKPEHYMNIEAIIPSWRETFKIKILNIIKRPIKLRRK